MIPARQLKTFKIQVDLSKVYDSIKGYKLREYNGKAPTIELNAKSPDDACFLAYENLAELLKGQSGITEETLEEVKRLMVIVELQVTSDWQRLG